MITQKVNRASQLFNLSPNRIIPLMNYLHEVEKQFELDRIIFRLLYVASQVAESGAAKTGFSQEIADLLDS